MKLFLSILFITFTLSGNTSISILGYPSDNIEYQNTIKEYLTTRLALGIDVKKNVLKRYYKKSNNHLIWIKDNNLSPQAKELIEQIKQDKLLTKKSKNSLNIDMIDMLLQKQQEYQSLNIQDSIKLDLLLTFAYDQYMNYLSYGDFNWRKFQDYLKNIYEKTEVMKNWRRTKFIPKKIALLEESIEKKGIKIALDYPQITYKNSNKLIEQIAKYEDIIKNGGYVKVPSVKVLKLNMKNKIVPVLRQRLLQSNDLSQEDFDSIVNEEPSVIDENSVIEDKRLIYDEALFNAVKSFQRSHGLQVDGVIGRDTIRHLNISLEEKIAKIKINLLRMRWLPRDLGKKHLIVNIPDYRLTYIENNKEVLNLPVVVGDRKHPTPVFSHKLTTVVLNPYWRVPQRIVQREIIPKLQENPEYLVSRGMNIHETWDQKSQTYDPLSIDWSLYLQTPEQKEQKIYPEVPYRFIQIPSKKNPLGKMKFLFHNKFSVYIHDTSAKSLFKRRQRAFSHGCIRLQTPYKLLKTIANEDKHLDYKKSVEVLKDIKREEILLDSKIPVHIIYLTAWMDDNGVMQYRDDIYSLDKIQQNIFFKN
jgi:murein L,D-transpeptidase YcbB/YkuD